VRRQFDLPSFDTGYLGSIGLDWETLIVGSGRWLLIYNWPVPAGYTVESTTVALQIPPSYPEAPIDMAYFCPALARKDNQPIGRTESSELLDGKSFQRWSRHRTNEAPWRPGDDDVATHLVLVGDWLEREFKIR
jgi:hypothetical protein